MSRSTALKPGKEGLRTLEELFGGCAEGWVLESTGIGADRIELSFARGIEHTTFELTRPRPDRSTPWRTRSIAVTLCKPSRDGLSQADEQLARAIFERVSKTSFADLSGRLRRDALLYSGAARHDLPSRLDRFHRVADHAPDFWKFIYPRHVALESEVRFAGKVVRINHATIECRLNHPQLEIGALRYFLDDAVPSQPRSDEYIDTCIGEADVLAGRTMGLLSDALEKASARAPKVVHLMTTCLPELIGDDPRSMLRKVGERGAAVFWSSKTVDAGQSLEPVIARALGDVGFSAQRDPGAVILAGVPGPREATEAGELLSALGLRVVGQIFPDLFLTSDEAKAASAVVWLDPVGWEKIGDDHFLQNGLAVVRYHPPFGVAGTRAWLERVRSVLHLEASSVDAVLAPHAEALEEVRRRARGHRVALVGDRADLEHLSSHGRAFGFSPAAVLCDLGFRVACFVQAPAPSPELRRPPERAGAGSIEATPFSTREELDRLLADDVDAAFTHFSHDPRLERHAIAGFCERDFELGVAGAARTGARLVRMCETRPFAGYRHRLASA